MNPIDTTIPDALDVPPFLVRTPSNGIIPATKPVPIATPTGGRLQAIATEVRQLHVNVQEGLRRTLPQAIRIGELLAEAKRKMPHGRWLRWIEENCGFGAKMAHKYVRLFKHHAELLAAPNGEPVIHFSIKSALKAITKPRKTGSTMWLRRCRKSAPLAAERRRSVSEREREAEAAERESQVEAAEAEAQSIFEKLPPADLDRLRELLNEFGPYVMRHLWGAA
jgi:Protein of unknown function (DUF3102)